MKSLYTMLMALLLVASSTAFAQTTAPAKSEAKRAPNEQEELALAAMEGLMSQPAERALPIIKKVLAGSQTTLVKKRALFVLSQIDSPTRFCCRRAGRRTPRCAGKRFATSASAAMTSRSPHCRRSTAAAMPT
jgi:hypothetical protein